jgi:hypothetical protein
MAPANSGHCKICGDWISFADNNCGKECAHCTNPICGNCMKKGIQLCGINHCLTYDRPGRG